MQQKQQWKKRVDVFRYIYSALINEYSTNEIKKEAFESNLFNEEQIKIIDYYADHKNELITQISNNLKQNWTYERLPVIDKAIFLAAISEFKATQIDAKIIIDQALITAKYYGGENSIGYINAILDKILMDKNG